MTVTDRVLAALDDGCYEAARAASLSGVPLSTLYHWARTELVVPSVSPTREMLWSYADLMTLRIVSWLRHPKSPRDTDGKIPASPMSRVRGALRMMAALDLDPWSTDSTRATVLVDRSGAIFLRSGSSYMDVHGNAVLDLPEGFLDLLAAFSLDGSAGGPDLVRPRPDLRIVPAKVAGEPHIAHTRITSRTVRSLVARGISEATISEWYEVPRTSIGQADDLERQLAEPQFGVTAS